MPLGTKPLPEPMLTKSNSDLCEVWLPSSLKQANKLFFLFLILPMTSLGFNELTRGCVHLAEGIQVISYLIRTSKFPQVMRPNTQDNSDHKLQIDFQMIAHCLQATYRLHFSESLLSDGHLSSYIHRRWSGGLHIKDKPKIDICKGQQDNS